MNKANFKLPVLIVLALLMGIMVYANCGFNAATLVIDARTLEKGRGEVRVEHVATGKVDALKFEIGDDQGAASFYTVGLPAARLERLTIAPLASRGNYEISRITLSNDSISYILDEQGGCVQKQLLNGVVLRQPCRQGPVLEFAQDGSVSITSIPDVGAVNKGKYRIASALIAALGFSFAGLWLFRATGKDRLSARLYCYGARAVCLVLVLMYLYQLYLICKYSVDLPYFEEWEYFVPQGLQRGFSWQWLFSFSGDHSHRILFTKFLAWVSLHLFNFNITSQKLVNYLIFGCLFLALVKFKNRVLGRMTFTLFPAFMLFLLSPIIYENHVFAFQSQIHLVLLFSVAMLYYAYSQDFSGSSTFAFSFAAICGIYSFTAGIVFALVALLCRSVYIVTQIVDGKISRHIGLKSLLISWCAIVSALLFWFHGYQKAANAPQYFLPFQSRFWDSFLNLLGLGFGYKVESIVPGAIILLLVILPALLLLTRKDTRVNPASWQIVSALLGVLAVLAVITVGRGGWAGSAKASRYAEFGIMLIPFLSIAWWLVLKTWQLRLSLLSLLWLLCFLGFANDWSPGIYRDLWQLDISSLECVERYSQGEGDGVCPDTHPLPIGKYLDQARQLDVSFTRQFVPPTR